MARKKATPSPDGAEKPVETKEQKMLRLGNKRVTRALSAIRLIGNLAAYKPTEAQVTAIEEALGTSCLAVVQRLNGTRKEAYTFTFNK
jgi:hypothetical protein